jgi:hypothetical protein
MSGFRGKYLQIWVKEPVRGCIIEDPRIIELAGRRFVVGEYVGRASSPTVREGNTYWIPIDDVLAFIEYPDRATVNLLAKEYEERDDRGGKK